MFDVVLFDLGGVVVDVDLERGAERFAELTGLPVHEFHRGFYLSGVKDRLDVGTLSEDEALAYVERITGAPKSSAKAALQAVLTVRPRVVNLVHALCARARIGVISNTDPIHADWIERESELLPVVESWTYSFMEQTLKPDPQLYQIACHHMDVSPCRTILVDDREDNCQTARDLGMHAILYTDFESVRNALMKAGVHP